MDREAGDRRRASATSARLGKRWPRGPLVGFGSRAADGRARARLCGCDLTSVAADERALGAVALVLLDPLAAELSALGLL